jgi:hypothetical protein
MSIVAKFQCNAVTRDASGNETVTLNPVTGKDGTANAQWSKWTPSGRLELTITNPPAQGQIEPGKEYLVTIAPAPDDE